jgi:tetratricopeptide (TPR) repeat protein
MPHNPRPAIREAQMTYHLILVWALVGNLHLTGLAQSAARGIRQVDARAEVAAALYAASATQAAAEREADVRLKVLRTQIDGLRGEMRSASADARRAQAALAAAQDEFVQRLAARDHAYAQEIAVFRRAVEDVAATEEGAAALARFNAGDELGAVSILDDMRHARDAARRKGADIESAAEGRRIATLALEGRTRGKFTTDQLITRYEEVTRLDPGMHWDWIELGRLYRDAGRLMDARRAAEAAANAATSDRDRAMAIEALGNVLIPLGSRQEALNRVTDALAIRERLARADPDDLNAQRDLAVSLGRLGDLLAAQGDRAGALAHLNRARDVIERSARGYPDVTLLRRDLSHLHAEIGGLLAAQGERTSALAEYRRGSEITEGLARSNPEDTRWQADLALAHDRIGNLLVVLGDRREALKSYEAGLSIASKLARADPGDLGLQRNLGVAHERIGDVLLAQKDEVGALEHYQRSHDIHLRLTQVSPDNKDWQRDLNVSHTKIGEVLEAAGSLAAALARYQAALSIAEQLTKLDPGHTGWRSDVLVAHERIGDVLGKQGQATAALEHFRAALAVAEFLVAAEPGNADWLRALLVSCVKLFGETLDKAYAVRALNIALDMQRRGLLAPADGWMVDQLKKETGR